MRVYVVTANVMDRDEYRDSTFAQAEHRWDELDREGSGVFPIIECVVDANCWKYIGGYAE